MHVLASMMQGWLAVGESDEPRHCTLEPPAGKRLLGSGRANGGFLGLESAPSAGCDSPAGVG